ncbi:hypothetical protein [Natrinema caseinilyticum]|uniref:hypothetical protein n=1 Tax=Natrinema caseinilyticum TaxID=2961570 RepID=UPI0020C47CA9|nr:hypothetical protein [Natrinema caseinilyticum]
MQTLEVTDEQYAFIHHLREEISESVVGKYGFVRERDAVQFLIDNLDEDTEIDADGDVDSSATDDVSASVVAAIDGEVDPTELEEVSYIETETIDADETSDDESDGAASDPDAAGDSESFDADDADGEAAGDGDDTNATAAGDVGSADDDDMLDEMMSLLETHDDKWEEATSPDYRYAVELPDGSTDQVQTRDDVRALLFKNYR